MHTLDRRAIRPRHPPRARRLLTFALLSIIVSLLGCRSSSPPPQHPSAAASESDGGQTLWLAAGSLRLKSRLYPSAHLSPHPRLVVVLHGDSPGAPTSYQYTFASRAAAQLDDALVAAILRPGYADGSGQHSTGQRGLANGDNYTPEVVDALAQAIAGLKGKYHPRATLVIGHSGGAALAGDLLARWPALLDGAVLVSCPCALAAWRWHMFLMQRNPLWLFPVRSLSPASLANRVSPSAHVRMLVGSDDLVAPPTLTQTYAQALHGHNVTATVTIVPGLQHNILLEPVAFAELRALLQEMAPPEMAPSETAPAAPDHRVQ